MKKVKSIQITLKKILFVVDVFFSAFNSLVQTNILIKAPRPRYVYLDRLAIENLQLVLFFLSLSLSFQFQFCNKMKKKYVQDKWFESKRIGKDKLNELVIIQYAAMQTIHFYSLYRSSKLYS